jgi:hypothetical protein
VTKQPDKEFKSFRDLAGKREPAPGDAKGSWSFDGDAPKAKAPGEPELAAGDGARERILRRPLAFAGMDTGPPAYRDDGSEEMQLLASFRVRTVFPADVAREVGRLPQDPAEGEFAGRLDLRKETIFTIDGDDAKDFDDAISIRRSRAAPTRSACTSPTSRTTSCRARRSTTKALARGTSVYLADQVVPMLPEALSNRLCSLVEAVRGSPSR